MMRKTALFGTIIIALFVIGLGVTIENSYAQTPELFTKIQSNTIVSEFNLPSTILQDPSSAIIATEIVSANLSILDNDSITVTLFDNTYTLYNDYIDTRGMGDFSWFGSNGEVTAIITVQNDKTVATIHTPDGTFIVEPITEELVNDYHVVKNVNVGQLVEAPHSDEISLSSVAGHPETYYISNIGEVILTHDRFRPSNLAEMEDVTVDVFAGYTTATENNNGGDNVVKRKIQNQLDKANHANQASRIPVIFNLVGTDDIRYVEQSSILNDRTNLLDHDARGSNGFILHGALNNLREEADRRNADILILFTSPSDINAYGGCGVAGSLPMAKHAHNSIAIVVYECLDGTTLTHEMGHLFGAGHNRDFREFGRDQTFGQFVRDGYGYYDVNAGLRTVMSYDCDSSEFDLPGVNPTCTPREVWSDPENNFFATVTPTPTGDVNNSNARAIFGAGPYIASIAGGTQSYDTTAPSGDFKWFDDLGKELSDAIKKIFNPGQTMSIKAEFNEPIHNNYPPTVTISDGTTITPNLAMVKSSNTVYTASHLLTNELGDVTLEFSSAKDLYLNDIVVTPTAGGTVIVEIPDTEKPVITLTGTTPPLEVGVDTYTELGATVTDNDATYSGIVTIGGDTVDTNTIGSYTVTYNAPADAANNIPDQKTRIVIVQDTTLPVITLNPPNPQSITQGDTYNELDAVCNDNSGDLSASIVIDSSSVDTAIIGSYQVTYDCKDSSDNNATQVIRTVNVVLPVPPVLAPVTSVTVAEGDSTNFVVSATKTNDDTIIFSITNAPSWVTISNTGGITETVTINVPTEVSSISYQATVRATDKDGYDEKSFTINITEVNQAPTFVNGIPVQIFEVGVPYSFTVTATDADIPAQTLSYSLGGTPPTGATYDGVTGLFEWTPTITQVGTNNFSFRVTDSIGAGAAILSTGTVIEPEPIQTEFVIPIIRSSDDAQQHEFYPNDGPAVLANTEINLVHNMVGLRFDNIPLEEGQLIKNAYIQFTSKADKFGDTQIWIYGQDDVNPQTFIEGENIDDRVSQSYDANGFPSNMVIWDIGDWNVYGSGDWYAEESGDAQQTPNLKLILQKIIDKPEWVNGNSVVFVIEEGYGNGDNEKIAYSFDDPTKSPKLHITLSTAPQPEPGQTEFSIPITQSFDDAEENYYGKIRLASNDLDLAQQTVGLRFNDVPIRQGQVIESAYIQFISQADKTEVFNDFDDMYFDDTYNDPPTFNVRIRADDTIDASKFIDSYYTLSDRITTSASVDWEMAAPWYTDDSGVDQQTPELKRILQEIVDKEDWTRGNSVAFLLADWGGDRDGYSYDNDPTKAPVLHFTLTP